MSRDPVKALIPVLLATVFLVRAAGELTAPSYSHDQSWQIQGTRNLLAGRGISRDLPQDDDWSRADSAFLHYWPAGYSLLLASLGLTGINLLLAAQVLNLASLSLLLGAIHALARRIDLDPRAYAAILALFCLPGNFLGRLTSTDLMSLTAFLWALFVALRGIERARGPVFYAGAGCLVFVAAFFRYSYYPLLPAIPAALILAGWWSGQRECGRNGLIAGTAAAMCLGAQTWIQAHTTLRRSRM